MDGFFAFLKPIEIAVAWVMVQFHSALTTVGMPADSGWTWALSIIGLVILMRILLIPLFVKQIKASRGLQLIQPEMRKIQAKYKGKTDQASRQAMTQETMALYKRTGTNPFSSCLPILAQSPIFFALFRVLNGLVGIAEGNRDPIGPMTQELAAQAEASTLFGAQLSATFLNSDTMSVKILTVVLIILMSATTFTTQRQLMRKNMPAASLDNPFAQQQKILLYALPVIFAVSGVNFPIGVLLYWLTTNIWSMGQQFYVIRRMPAPGSAAEKALMERRAKRGKALPAFMTSGKDEEEPAEPIAPRGQRVQPKRKDRQRKGGQAAQNRPAPTASTSDAENTGDDDTASTAEGAPSTPEAPTSGTGGSPSGKGAGAGKSAAKRNGAAPGGGKGQKRKTSAGSKAKPRRT